MIKLENIINRVYEEKELVRFEVHIETETYKKKVHVVTFSKNIDSWNLGLIIQQDENLPCESKVYNFSYTLPMQNPKLELIASTGLKYLQQIVKEETQNYISLDFAIGGN